MTQFAGLLFDCDGLLVDTEAADFEAWKRVYAEHGCTLEVETWIACIGGLAVDFDPWTHLATTSGRTVDPSVVRPRLIQYLMELTAVQPLRPGVGQYLESARSLRLKVGVVSNSRRAWVNEVLETRKVHTRFDSFTCREDASNLKPHPDLYLAALATLQLRPDEAIAFEDSPRGVEAAKRAGIFCVAVPNPLTLDLAFDQADMCITSFEDISLSHLILRAEELAHRVESMGA